MSHLIEAAHQRVAYAGGPFSIRQVADCRDGAVQALRRVGRDPADLPTTESAALNIRQSTRDELRLMRRLPRPPSAAEAAG